MVDIEEGRLRPLGFARDKKSRPYNNVHRIAVSGVVDIEEGRTEVPALHRQDNQENHEAGASSRSQMLR